MLTKQCNVVAKGGQDGAYYYHKIRSIADGSEMIIETDYAHYSALGLKGAGAPDDIPPGYTWVGSGGDHRYDTPSGLLEEGYFVFVDDEYVAKVDGKQINFSKVEPSTHLEEVNQVLAAEAAQP